MNEMVTISKDEYQRLLSARDDLEDITAARRALDTAEESFPVDVVERLLAGESPLSVFRMYRKLSQSELSRISGVNRVQIVDIEKGRSTGSVETLKRLAAALDLDIDDLV